MTYKQIQAALKEHKLAGRTAIALNLKMSVLKAELERIEQALAAESTPTAVAQSVAPAVAAPTETATPNHWLVTVLLCVLVVARVAWLFTTTTFAAIAVLSYESGRTFRYLCDEAIDNGRYVRNFHDDSVVPFCEGFVYEWTNSAFC